MVLVIVKDHIIKDIEITKHRHGKGAAAEKITEDVIRKQSLQVDVVTGATVSSKIILKAIENALKVDYIYSGNKQTTDRQARAQRSLNLNPVIIHNQVPYF